MGIENISQRQDHICPAGRSEKPLASSWRIFSLESSLRAKSLLAILVMAGSSPQPQDSSPGIGKAAFLGRKAAIWERNNAAAAQHENIFCLRRMRGAKGIKILYSQNTVFCGSLISMPGLV